MVLKRSPAHTRAIFCAGAGHFAAAHITLTPGCTVGRTSDAASEIALKWNDVTDRQGEIVPDYGFQQGEREVASTGSEVGEFTVAH